MNFIPNINSNNAKTLGIIKSHSVWARDNISYDQKDWTLKANYSYSQFTEALSRKYKVLSLKSLNDLGKKLRSCDILLIMTPTVPFSKEEKSTMRNYVLNGGELFIIVDHTDLYGHSRVINNLIEGWGIKINYDAVFNPESWHGTVRLQNSSFTSVRPLTAASLSALRPSYIMAWTNNWVSENANYNEPNFFGDLTWTEEDKYGDWPIGLKSRVGKGYVTIWSDSTMFSNFALYQPRVLSSLGYLMDHGRYFSVLFLYYPLFISMILIPLVICPNPIRDHLLIILCLGSILTGGLYYIYSEGPHKFYPNKDSIAVYGKEELLKEPMRNRPPSKDSISNLYSNLPRFGIYPEWKSTTPPKGIKGDRALWFTTYETFLKRQSDLPLYTVIVNDSSGIAQQGYSRISADKSKNMIGIKSNKPNRYVWILPDLQHTKKIGSNNIFINSNVLNDIAIGNWWGSIDVSPYRKEMIKRFTEWIKYQTPITRYSYPMVGIRAGQHDLRGVDNEGNIYVNSKTNIHISNYGDIQYVYLGSELWGIYLKEGNKELIIGGPETSDNSYKYNDVRFFLHYY